MVFIAKTLLKRTKSRCPVCHAECSGEVWKIGDAKQQWVVMRRRCTEHGEVEVCIASDARFYWLAQGDPQNACCGGNACSASDGAVRGTLGRNAAGSAGFQPVPAGILPDGREGASQIDNAHEPRAVSRRQDAGDHGLEARAPLGARGAPFERLSTCLALIEIVNSCNLACPTWFADSPRSTEVDAVPLAELQARIQGVIDHKGGIEILQLSGGEPTLHPQFAELLAWLHANPGIDYVLLNTNGVRLATDDAFLDQLGKTFRYGKFQLYLQFDGPQEAGQRTLRGADLRAMRRRAIERCGALLKEFELNETNTFRLFIKPFMDAGTWDEDRIDRCCTHVIRPDGKLDSFCRYYSGFAADNAPPRAAARAALPRLPHGLRRVPLRARVSARDAAGDGRFFRLPNRRTGLRGAGCVAFRRAGALSSAGLTGRFPPTTQRCRRRCSWRR